MGFWRGIGKFIGGIYDIRMDKWISFDYLQNSLSRSTRIIEDTLTAPAPNNIETFEEALQRQGLSEQDLAARINRFTGFIWFYGMLTLTLFSYSCTSLLNHAWFKTCMGIALTLFCAGHLFRYHYWRFLLMQRELGYTPRQWLLFLLRRKLS